MWILGKLCQQQTAETDQGLRRREKGLAKWSVGSGVRSGAEGYVWYSGLVRCCSPFGVNVLTESFACVSFQGVKTAPGLWSSSHRAGWVSLIWTESYKRETGQNSRRLSVQVPITGQPPLGIRAQAPPPLL